MAEDYTTATEVDKSNRLEILEDEITVSGILPQDTAYAYWDKGVGYFGSNFTHFVHWVPAACKAGGRVTLWGVSNNVSPTIDWLQGLSVEWKYLNGAPRVYVQEAETEGATDSTVAGLLTFRQEIWVKIIRDDATLSVYVYGDARQATLLDTLSVAIPADRLYRHLFPVSSHGHSPIPETGFVNGTLQNWLSNVWVEIPMEPADGTYMGAGYGEDFYGDGPWGGEGYTIRNWTEVEMMV